MRKTCLRGFRPGPTQTGLYNTSLKYRVKEVQGLHYLRIENKGANKMRGFVFAYAKRMFSHAAANIMCEICLMKNSL